jgi:hypothetical protein
MLSMFNANGTQSQAVAELLQAIQSFPPKEADNLLFGSSATPAQSPPATNGTLGNAEPFRIWDHDAGSQLRLSDLSSTDSWGAHQQGGASRPFIAVSGGL